MVINALAVFAHNILKLFTRNTYTFRYLSSDNIELEVDIKATSALEAIDKFKHKYPDALIRGLAFDMDTI